MKKKVERIVLIEPPRVDEFGNLRILGSFGEYKAAMYWPPLDLTIIAGILRKHNIELKIIDMNAENMKLDDLKFDKEYDMAIFTTSITTLDHDLKLHDKIKSISPKTMTVAIGTAVSSNVYGPYAKDKVDVVIADPEPEHAILHLIENMEDNKAVPRYFETGKKLMRFNYIWPAHDLLDNRIYFDMFSQGRPIAITYTSRGCGWNKCNYCSCPPFFTPYRERSIEDVIEEIKWIESLGIRDVRFFDAEINWNGNRAIDLAIAIRVNTKIKWTANIRADRFTEQQVIAFKNAGCVALNIGFESADENVRNICNKGLSVSQVKYAVDLCRKHGIQSLLYCIFGLYGETQYSMEKTLKAVLDIDPSACTFGIATPHKGTRFYNILEMNGYLRDVPLEEYSPSKKPVYDYENLTSDQIFEFSKKAYKSFYKRPFLILNRLTRTRSFRELKDNVRTYFRMVK